MKARNQKWMWTLIKNLANMNLIQTPRKLLEEGKIQTSLKMIAQILQIHFINKIIQIRNKFKPPHMDPIYLLKRLIVKPLSQFKLKEITLEVTKKIIKAMKASNTVGFDRISSKVLKLSLDLSAVLLTHAINVSIRTSTFPEALKVARVLPILKSNKNVLDKMNYRPISNLHSAEKVLET